MKILTLILLLTIASITGCQQTKEGVMVEVNGIEVTQSEFDRDFEIVIQSLIRERGEDALSQIGFDGRTVEDSEREALLEGLIVKKLIVEDAKSRGITVAETELKSAEDAFISDVGDESAFQDFLSDRGIDMDYFEDYINYSLISEKHREDVISETEITESDLRKYFDDNLESLIEVRASHILLGNEEDALAIINRLENGEKFEDIALLESLDSESAIRGGDLGYFSRGFYSIIEFEDSAFTLPVGEVSGVVKTEVGYHVIRVDDRLDSFEDLKDKAEQKMKDEIYYEYVKNLVNNAEIKRYI
ncbi:MAG: peptidylprolyl isomerase [Gudongella sp.]|jgi:foldase protein PrsA|nr:peptidylprolyl isomerase [Gudongella sp.]